MWKVLRIVKKGKYLYAVVPDHPKASKNKYVLEHRIVMENYLQRKLLDTEVVHHKNNNTHDNNISNLEVLNFKKHIRLHALKQGRLWVKLKCPNCNKEFEKEKNKTYLQKPSKFTCCSKVCRGKFSRRIQIEGITTEVQTKLDANFIEEFRKYIS